MDMNELFCHHQLALMNAAWSSRAEAGRIHVLRVGHYAQLVREWRDERDLPPYLLSDGARIGPTSILG